MHDWSDDWFKRYGNDLYDAQLYISDYTKRWSRCNLLSKEKYGTIRYEHIVPPYGHAYCLVAAIWAPWKKYVKVGDKDYSYRPLLFAWNECWLYRKWAHFGWYICGLAIKKAIRRWPHLEDELCADFMPETKFGRKCLGRYWK